MDTFNFKLVDVRHRKGFKADIRFPKELLWYFGIDKLAFKERGGGRRRWRGGDIL
jgi:hypothetical protein